MPSVVYYASLPSEAISYYISKTLLYQARHL